MQRLRSENKTRPLLQGLSETETRARITELLTQRTPTYSRAHMEIETDGDAPDTTARHIYEALKYALGEKNK
jgi:shikimate kinase